MYLVKTPKFIQTLFPNFTWNVPSDDKVIYLTFDDGPIPDVTPWVMDVLEEYDAKGTFFCVGNNVKKHPEVYQEVLDRGHAVGNHTLNHLSGWANTHLEYLHDIRNCAHLVNSKLFRPPYGRLKPNQAQFLMRHYDIIMWDVLSGDFDQNLEPSQCLGNVIMKAGPGSIVVFHDSIKAEKNLKYALPKTLAYFADQGFRFETIKESTAHQIKRAS